MNLKNKKVLVVDHGLFHCLAERLSRDFGEVYYYAQWESSFPVPDKALIGDGIPGLTRVDKWQDYIDEVDLICFFDIYNGPDQARLRKQGYRVFGSARGEVLELDRIGFREILAEEGLPVPKYNVITGLDGENGLREYLRPRKDKWIKISKFRGIQETFHYHNYLRSRPLIDSMAFKTGPYQDMIKVIVEDPLKGIEVAADWFFSGKHLPIGMWGYENKDSGYIGKASTYEKLPEPIRDVTENLTGVMKKLDVRCMVSLETRVTPAGTPYCTDPCMRGPSPPAELMAEMYENFSEVVWAVAGGEEVEPKMAAKYGAEVLLKSDWARENPLPLDFPKSKFIKFRNLTKIDGQFYHLSGDKETLIGAAIGMGDSLEEAQSNALEAAAEVKGEDITYDETVFDEFEEVLATAKKSGLGVF